MDNSSLKIARGFLKKVVEETRFGKESSNSISQNFCGDIDMRIARDGTWYYKGSPIERFKLVKLFASILTRDKKGHFWLKTKVERCRITVDDAPFLAVEMNVDSKKNKQQLIFRTNVDDIVIAGPKHSIIVRVDPETGEPSPYLEIRSGIEALITRSVFYDLVELGIKKIHERNLFLGVWCDGIFFNLGCID